MLARANLFKACRQFRRKNQAFMSGKSNHVVLGMGIANLLKEISALIETTKGQVSRHLNSSLVILYWKIGQITHLPLFL